jgi:hypothetical protein
VSGLSFPNPYLLSIQFPHIYPHSPTFIKPVSSLSILDIPLSLFHDRSRKPSQLTMAVNSPGEVLRTQTTNARKHMNPRRKFTTEEDEKLRVLVSQIGNQRWEVIAHGMPGRTARQCRDRYKNYLLDSLVSAPWSAEEDSLLKRKYVEIGPRWVEISKFFNGRSGNDVKNRWHRHLAKTGPKRVFPSLVPIQESVLMASQPPERGTVLQLNRNSQHQFYG